MAPEVIASETVIVHDDAMGIDRKVIAGQPVPPDLVEAYQATGDKPKTKQKKEDSAEPFEGYDELTADEVVERLQEASDEEVAAVKAYEAAQKKPRKTIAEFEKPQE